MKVERVVLQLLCGIQAAFKEMAKGSDGRGGSTFSRCFHSFILLPPFLLPLNPINVRVIYRVGSV